jgi:hypothetical protein
MSSLWTLRVFGFAVLAIAAGTACNLSAEDPAAADAAVRTALAKTVDLKYTAVPLQKVARDLQTKLGVPVCLDRLPLGDSGITADTPVTFAISGVSAKSAIALMLPNWGLTTVIGHGAVLITTPDEAYEAVARAYDVSDLVGGGPGPADGPPDFNQLIDVVHSAIRPTSWESGTVTRPAFDAPGIKAIVIHQTDEVHEDVAALLSALRSVRHAPAERIWTNGPQTAHGVPAEAGLSDWHSAVAKPSAPTYRLSEQRVYRALERPIELRYENTPLAAVVEDLHRKLGVPVLLDSGGLADVAVGGDTRITFSVSNISAESAIDLLLRPLKVTSLVLHESLVVTTIEKADEELQTRVYDVFDLLPPAPKSRALPKSQRSLKKPEYDDLIDLVTRSISAESWIDTHGPGQIRPFEAAGIRALVVFQTAAVHAKLEALFAQLRALRGSPSSGQGRCIGKQPAETAVEAALWAKLSFDFSAVPLREVAATLARRAGLPIILDQAAFKDEPTPAPQQKVQLLPAKTDKSDKTTERDKTNRAAKNAVSGERFNMPVTAAARDVSLETALYLVLRPLRLTWTYDSECLVITSEEAAHEDYPLVTRCYDVSDFFAAGADDHGRDAANYHELEEALTTIEQTAWDIVGGRGALVPLDRGGVHAIVVSQTWPMQRAVESLLADLRRLRKK